MLKFHQIVLKKFLTLFFALFFIVGAIVYYWVYDFYINSTKISLLQDIELISLNVNQNKNLDNLANQIKNKLNLRLTIVDSDGKILAESHKDKKKMDNHRYRDEIMQSDTQPFGFKIRVSKTINKKLLYVAKKYNINHKYLYIRVAKELKGIKDVIFLLGVKIFIVLIIFFIAIFSMTYKINTQIQHETKKIVDFLKSLTKKNKSTYINSDYSEEFSHITKLLTKVSQIIVKKENLHLKYTQKLQEANKQKDDIISAISHEFKNPIAVVNGYSQTLLEDEDINPNIRKKFLTKIYKNGSKLSELIDTLRLSMKLDGEQQNLNKNKINIYNLIKENGQNLQLNYVGRKFIIEGDKTLNIEVDKTLFGIVITNLIENAFKYSEDEIYIRITKNKISIIDSGIGISKNDLKNITDKFYRVHTNSWNNSLGLGLFLVNKILNLHNFKLEIKSNINEGSKFMIIF